MKKSTAIERRILVQSIVLENRRKFFMSVDDWWSVVASKWPNGWSDAPCSKTVKKVLFNLSLVGRVDHKTFSRGWFTQERFR